MSKKNNFQKIQMSLKKKIAKITKKLHIFKQKKSETPKSLIKAPLIKRKKPLTFAPSYKNQKDIKKEIEKIIKAAKKKKDDTIESAAEALREKAIEVTKDVLDKLEK